MCVCVYVCVGVCARVCVGVGVIACMCMLPKSYSITQWHGHPTVRASHTWLKCRMCFKIKCRNVDVFTSP